MKHHRRDHAGSHVLVEFRAVRRPVKRKKQIRARATYHARKQTNKQTNEQTVNAHNQQHTTCTMCFEDDATPRQRRGQMKSLLQQPCFFCVCHRIFRPGLGIANECGTQQEFLHPATMPKKQNNHAKPWGKTIIIFQNRFIYN
jgi:hypothetical protein